MPMADAVTGQPVDPREGEQFFLNVAEKLDNPFPDLKYFRENRPVFYYAPLNSWFIFRYDDVYSLFHDARLSANRMKGLVDAAPAEVRGELRTIVPYLESWMLMKDGADHARVRSRMQAGLTPPVVHQLSGQIQRSADELLSWARPPRRLDAAGQYAFLLPAYVLSDLFGVSREDAGRLVQWSLDFVNFFNNIPITVDASRCLVRSGFAMIDYTRALIAARRARPCADFLGALCAAQGGAGGLTDDEVAGNIMLLLLAGHVAVCNLIGNALYLLLTHPDQFARVKAEPALLHNAIEETLRFETPITMIPRVAAEEVEWHGHTFRPGQLIQLNMASANRDAAHFPDAERFDITRRPGNHLAFGTGVHGCLGAALAREVASIALATLFRRLPGLRLDEGKGIVWYRNAANRGPSTLPLVWDA
jgi:cytochrome P450